jgi:hypothetical protein
VAGLRSVNRCPSPTFASHTSRSVAVIMRTGSRLKSPATRVAPVPTSAEASTAGRPAKISVSCSARQGAPLYMPSLPLPAAFGWAWTRRSGPHSVLTVTAETVDSASHRSFPHSPAA